MDLQKKQELKQVIEFYLQIKPKLFGKKLPNDSLFAKLKGEEGSKIELLVYRKSAIKNLKLTVTGDVVPIKKC